MVLDSLLCPDCNNINIVKPSKKTVAVLQKQSSRSSVAPEKLTDVIFHADQTFTELTQRATLDMRRVFLFANPIEPANQSVRAALGSIQTSVADRLKAEGFLVLEAPKGLKSADAIAWINQRAIPGDVALSIQTDAFFNPDARGVSAFYIVGNQERQQQAQRLLQQLVQDVPQLVNRGARPDTETALGYLAFTRQIEVPAIALTLGFETSPLDRAIIAQYPQEIARSIVNGLTTWSRALSTRPPVYSSINIIVNGKKYDQKGIIVNGNAYIPVNAADPLKVNLAQIPNAKQIDYKNTTYVRAIDLRNSGAFGSWIPTRRTVILRTATCSGSEKIEQIMGRGNLSRKTLEAFLKKVNPQALERFPDIAQLYLEEAKIEGINPDIAFAHALLETNFFRFSGDIQPSQNNFGALGAVGGSGTASFASARIGVRAHIQLLKAYASVDPLMQQVVTPRFRFVLRGSAPRVELLSGRYSTDPMYGKRILAILRRLYQPIG